MVSNDNEIIMTESSRFTSLVCRSDIVFVLFEVQVREKAYELKSKCLNLPKPLKHHYLLFLQLIENNAN